MNVPWIVRLDDPTDLNNGMDDEFIVWADTFADAAEQAEARATEDGSWRVPTAMRMAEDWEVRI